MPHRRARSVCMPCLAATVVVLGTVGLPTANAQFMPPSLPPPEQPAGNPGPGASSTLPAQLVVDVIIEGNRATKDYDVQKYIHTRKDREYDPEVVNSDVRRLVTSGLFRDVKTSWR